MLIRLCQLYHISIQDFTRLTRNTYRITNSHNARPRNAYSDDEYDHAKLNNKQLNNKQLNQRTMRPQR